MSFEQLWAPWRHDYVVAATADERAGVEGQCVFCAIGAAHEPGPDNLMVWRGELVFAVLNAYPYATGHMMVLPIRHMSELSELEGAESAELWDATRTAVKAVESAYAPDGMNLGANLGRAAGAGIPRHLHLHVVPRWSGDTNFMTSVGGLRVMPESMALTRERLAAAWADIVNAV